MVVARLAFVFLAALALVVAVPGAPRAQAALEQVGAKTVVGLLALQGVEDLSIGEDSVGDPLIEARHDGLVFSVLFYNCRNERCGRVQFRGSFETDSAAEARDTAQGFNSQKVFGKAYIRDGGTLVVEHSVLLDGGVTEEHLSENIALWLEILGEVGDSLGY